ncbi:MAG TPA: outer membrane beta-barrel protein, partial [Roseomonas sp.]
MSLKKALLAATIMSLPLAAQAQPVTGLYIAAGAGVNWLQSTKDAIDGPAGVALGAAGRQTKLNFEHGWVGVGSLGFGFGNGLRLEVEGSYRDNDVADFRVGGITSNFQGGRARSYGAMGNVLFDFAIPGLPVTPYVGGGVGYQWHEYDGVRSASFGPGAASRSLTIDDDDGQFAYQGIAGLAFNLGVPGLALTAEYRFMGTLSPELTGTFTNRTAAGVTTVSRGRVEVDNYNHSALIGLRYAFNAPRPAPVVAVAPAAPAAAPAPARTYLVFFDFDRADLTDRARQIIGEAAQAVNTTGTTRI